MVTLMLWLLATTVAGLGAGLAAASIVPARRTTGLIATTAAVAVLLILLGLDLPALVWLGLGGVMALLAVAAGSDAPREKHRGPAAWLLLSTVAGGMLLAILYRVALQVDWRPLPPDPVAGQTALVGGALLTGDVALLVAVTLLLAATFAVTAVWRGAGRGRSR